MAKKLVKKGKWWFRGLKRLMTLRYKPTNFVYLGDEFENGSLILSNHEGTDAPIVKHLIFIGELNLARSYFFTHTDKLLIVKNVVSIKNRFN